jgi:hypothetical protein
MLTTHTGRQDRKASKCDHRHATDHVIAGMRRTVCADCGRITLSFASVGALGRTIDDVRRDFEDTLVPVA